ncbi:TLD-domain-containing protein [Cunninghamella echinulata]|nr:TLD-domain-containing protein [Cunninghamella echinulata]
MDQLHSLRIKHERSPSIQQQSFSNLFTPYDYFYLSLQLPQNALSWSAIEKTQRKIKNNDDVTHQLIYSSRHHGNSWQRFVQSIGQQGATLLVIKTKNDGAVFGGYTDEPWQLMTDWYGSSLNFLYQLSGHYTPWNMFGVWNATSINDHYQYLCWGKKSLPNGLGMGGQFEYSGLWINADFIHGHSRGGPYCSTYQSPRLTKMDPFEIDEVEGKLKINK